MLPIARNIIHMLMEKDLLTQSEVVDGSSIFSIARQRNRFCYFKRPTGTSFFIKTGHETEPGAHRAMALEAKFYDHFSSDHSFEELRPFLTRQFDFDANTGTLISEFIDGGEDLSVVTAHSPSDLSAHLGQMAKCLVILHASKTDKIDPKTFGFETLPPWIFRLSDEPSPLSQLRARSKAGAATIDKIIRNENCIKLLDQLGTDWKFDCLIHGDVKPQNFLIHGRNGSKNEYKLIDWERATMGDPDWDVACGAMIPIILRVFEKNNRNEDMTVENILTPAVSSQISGFLSDYRVAAQTRGLSAVNAQRCSSLIMARLLAAAYEVSFATDQVNPITEILLEIANHLLESATPKLFLRSVQNNSKAA